MYTFIYNKQKKVAIHTPWVHKLFLWCKVGNYQFSMVITNKNRPHGYHGGS
jgi:hypothetical protein